MARKLSKQQAIEDVREALKSLRNSEPVHELRWANSCLVRQLQTEKPELTQRQALHQVLKTVRDALAAKSPDYAAILQGRFWEGCSRAEMVNGDKSGRWEHVRTFDEKQKKALIEFTELLHAREYACQQKPPPGNASDPKSSQDAPNPKPSIPEPPYHPLSAVTIIVLDGVWGVPEIVATVSIVGLPTVPVLMVLSAVTAIVIVSLIQRVLGKESQGMAIVKGVVAGVIVGIPYPFMGTVFGAILLAWAGGHKLPQPREAAFEDMGDASEDEGDFGDFEDDYEDLEDDDSEDYPDSRRY